MLLKTPSNPHVGSTPGSSVRLELHGFSQRFWCRFARATLRYRKTFLAIMAASILVSAVLAFTWLRPQKAAALPEMPRVTGNPSAGISSALNAYTILKQANDLQEKLQVLSKKDTLTAADSLEFRAALVQLRGIAQSFKP